MFKQLDLLNAARENMIVKFESGLKEKAENISLEDRNELNSRINIMISQTKNFALGGGVLGLFFVWNTRNSRNLGAIFKFSAAIFPPIICGTYAYLSNMQKIYALQTILAIKYFDKTNKI